ncbi:MAG: Si-specific NAD(P)(+) transhydrogenase [Myxococcota bacterium]|nr:Si-specific NAD(P)(+) transhydrogenase [Myxococcota bacterium]
MPQYDLVVIGSGPAGEKGAAQAAYFGKRVAVIESRVQPGGVCVHTGTLPSKTLRESSLYLSGVKSRGLYGVNYLIKRDVSVQDFMYRRHAVVRREVERIIRNCDRHRIDVISGRASFIDAHTLRVTRGNESQDIGADKVLIATGSTPFRPDYLPWTDPQVFDSDTILDIQAMPKSLCIIGGGVIGCEYATIFAAMGVRVVLLDNRDTILPFLDREIAEVLRQQMMELGVQLLMRESVKAVKRIDDNQLAVEIETGEDFCVTSLLFAAGRNGNTAGLGLDKVGIAVDKRGALSVTEHFQTSVPNIYAAGDVIGFPALASTSMEQARVAMCHAFELHYKERLAHQWPLGIYTIPEVSSVGLTEEECKEKKLSYAVGRAMFANNARGQIMGEESGMLKLVFDTATLKLLGVHIIGDRASEIIHIGQCAMNLGGTLDYFIQNVFNYPTLSEAYKYAAYDGLGRLSKAVQREGVAALKQ